MTPIETYNGYLHPTSLSDTWVLIFGGVTREGNRRARRATAVALASGNDVVWFDGFEETDPDTGNRVPLDSAVSDEGLFILGFVEREAQTLSAKLRLGGRLRSSSLARKLWYAVLRRVGLVLRPRACWKAVRDDVRVLAAASAPASILYCDDYSITSAWRAGRLWESTPIVASLGDTR